MKIEDWNWQRDDQTTIRRENDNAERMMMMKCETVLLYLSYCLLTVLARLRSNESTGSGWRRCRQHAPNIAS